MSLGHLTPDLSMYYCANQPEDALFPLHRSPAQSNSIPHRPARAFSFRNRDWNFYRNHQRRRDGGGDLNLLFPLRGIPGSGCLPCRNQGAFARLRYCARASLLANMGAAMNGLAEMAVPESAIRVTPLAFFRRLVPAMSAITRKTQFPRPWAEFSNIMRARSANRQAELAVLSTVG